MGRAGATGCTNCLAQETADGWISPHHSSSGEMGVSAPLSPAEQVCREQLSSHLINQVSNSISGEWSCHQSKERIDQKSFLLLPLAAEGQQQLETRIYLAPQAQPWTGTLPKPGSNHSRDSRLGKGSSSPRFGKDGLCCASLELAEAQVWLVPSYLLTVKPKKKKVGKSFSLQLIFLPRAFHVPEKLWKSFWKS